MQGKPKSGFSNQRVNLFRDEAQKNEQKMSNSEQEVSNSYKIKAW
jgi:hypothetical protein